VEIVDASNPANVFPDATEVSHQAKIPDSMSEGTQIEARIGIESSIDIERYAADVHEEAS
jgi:hypothetical protein